MSIRTLGWKREAQPMLTNLQDAMLVIYLGQSIVWFRYIFAITEKLIARQALLFEVQRLTSPCLPHVHGLISLFST